MMVMIKSGRVSVIGLGLTKQVVLLLLLLLLIGCRRLLVTHSSVQLLLLLLLLVKVLLLLVLLHLHLTLWRLVVAVPKRWWETPLSH